MSLTCILPTNAYGEYYSGPRTATEAAFTVTDAVAQGEYLGEALDEAVQELRANGYCRAAQRLGKATTLEALAALANPIE